MAPLPSFKLNTGGQIPAIGLGQFREPVPILAADPQTGTWQAQPGEVQKAVAFALKDGYRHIDAAL